MEMRLGEKINNYIMDTNMENKMETKIEAVRVMMLDRFSGVDRKLTAIEQLLKKLIELGNPGQGNKVVIEGHESGPKEPLQAQISLDGEHQQAGNTHEKRCCLTDKNMGGEGTELGKNQDDGKKVPIEGGDGGPSHESGPKKPLQAEISYVGEDLETGNQPEKRFNSTDKNTGEEGFECSKNEGKVEIGGGDEFGPKKPWQAKISSDDVDQETNDQIPEPMGGLSFSYRGRYGPPCEAGGSCGWSGLYTNHYGTYNPHWSNYSFGKDFCGPAWVGLEETDFSKKNGPSFGSHKFVSKSRFTNNGADGCPKLQIGMGLEGFGSKVVNADDVSEKGLNFGGQDAIFEDYGVLLQHSSNLYQWAKTDSGPLANAIQSETKSKSASVESDKGLDLSTLVEAKTDPKHGEQMKVGPKPEGSNEGEPKTRRPRRKVKKVDLKDTEKGVKRTRQDAIFKDSINFNQLGAQDSWTGSLGQNFVKTGQDRIFKTSFKSDRLGTKKSLTGSWNKWSKDSDKKDVLVRDSSKPDLWAKKDSELLGKVIQNETVCESGSVESDKSLDWSKLVEAKVDSQHRWGLKRKHCDSPNGSSNDGPISSVPFTTSKRRVDTCTADEQETVSEIEPIMQSIQRIMHHKEYNDGDPLSDDPATDGGWGAVKSDQGQQTGSSGGWGAAKTTPETGGGWGAPKSDQSQPTGSSSEKEPEKVSGAWGQNVSKADEHAWGSKKSQNDTATGSGSGLWGQKVVKTGEGWGRKQTEAENEKGSSAWGQKVVICNVPTWGAKKSQKESEELGSGAWGQKVATANDGPTWGAKKSQNESGSGSGWGQKKDPVSVPDGSTDKGQEDGEQKLGSRGWNRKAEQKPDQGGGWKKKKENWGPKRDRPARPVGGPNDAPRPLGPLTVTRQRLDIFTSDEQEILTVIEPIMQSVRRIMNPIGYNDGDPLSADDQTYILDNIFAHHPDKTQKAGAGVDYIMVAKNTQWQDSRCFFVVSTDGRKEDFSYRKCLESFVRGKFPDRVDEFIPKYFKKNQPRPPMNRDEAGTPRTPRTPGSRPGWGRDSNVVGDDSATPASGWKKDASTGPEDGGTPATTGWKNEGSTEGGAGATGWKKEASTAPEAGGASASGWDQAGDGGNAKKSGWGS